MGETGYQGSQAFDHGFELNKQANGQAASPSFANADSLLRLRRAGATLLLLCLATAAIGVAAWTDQQRLLSLTLLLLLPALIFRANNRLGAFLVAFAYYGTATRAVPGIICGFFPGLSGATGLTVWAIHATLLSLPWAAMYPPQGATELRRVFGVAIAMLVLTIPPFGLFHWGSPLMAAGLLYPGWRWLGLLITLGLLALLAAGNSRSRIIHGGIVGAVLLAVFANATYRTPSPPVGWRSVSLHLGKSPELWSDEMASRREFLVETAMRELAGGAKLVVFPESISGSNRRSQTATWHRVFTEAKARGATVLVGEENWSKDRSVFKNALVGYGMVGGEGTVVVSSQVPMPIGDWKFGYEDGADTNILGIDTINLYGRKVAFSLCYEDFLLWPHRGLLSGRAELLVSATNQWPSSGTSAEVGQDMSRSALARMAGVPLLTAKNH